MILFVFGLVSVSSSCGVSDLCSYSLCMSFSVCLLLPHALCFADFPSPAYQVLMFSHRPACERRLGPA